MTEPRLSPGELSAFVTALTDRLEAEFTKSAMAVELATGVVVDVLRSGRTREAMERAEANLVDRLKQSAKAGRARNTLKRVRKVTTAIEEGRPIPYVRKKRRKKKTAARNHGNPS